MKTEQKKKKKSPSKTYATALLVLNSNATSGVSASQKPLSVDDGAFKLAPLCKPKTKTACDL